MDNDYELDLGIIPKNYYIILANYLVATFKGSIVTKSEPNKTPAQLFDECHWISEQDIDYRCTDKLAYLVNKHFFGAHFANYIANHISCDTCRETDKDNIIDLDELLTRQDDSAITDNDFEDAIYQRCKRYAKHFKSIFKPYQWRRMASLVIIRSDDENESYDTNDTPSQKLIHIIATYRPVMFEQIRKQNEIDEHRDKCIFAVIIVIVFVLLITIIGSVLYYASKNQPKPRPKPSVQRYISNHYGQYHLPYRVSNMIYNPKSQTLYLHLTKYASKHDTQNTTDRALRNVLDNIITHSNNKHFGCTVIAYGGKQVILKRNPKQQIKHNHYEQKVEKRQDKERQKHQHQVHAVFIPCCIHSACF